MDPDAFPDPAGPVASSGSLTPLPLRGQRRPYTGFPILPPRAGTFRELILVASAGTGKTECVSNLPVCARPTLQLRPQQGLGMKYAAEPCVEWLLCTPSRAHARHWSCGAATATSTYQCREAFGKCKAARGQPP